MKKYLLSLMAAFTVTAQAQVDLRTATIEKEMNAAAKSGKVAPGGVENRNADQVDLHAYNKTESPQYFNDVIIENSALNQRNVRISAAFNGWLYSAYSTYNTTSNSGGITFRRSKNGGVTWTTLDSYLVTNVKYDVFDIVVVGTDTNNLTLFMTGVNNNVTGGTYTLFFDKYNATTGVFTGNWGTGINYGTRKVYDAAIASDYKFPAVGASPYSIGVVYSVYGSPRDSVIFVCSTNGGTSLNVRQPLYATTGFGRHVSLDYGRSSSYNNGRYFASWERLSSSTARNANIYVSRNATTINGTWTAPKNLDSLDANMLGVCRRPAIAVQHNNVNNDSGNVSAVVLVERDWGGTGTDYDVLGFHNHRAASNINWARLDVSNASTYDMQPHIVFDPGNNNFLAVYYDSTGSKLPYKVNSMNLSAPNTWGTVTGQYNDLTTNLKQAWPRVDISPPAVKTVHVWNSEGAAGKGVALFDAEYLVTSFKDVYEPVITSDIYPNPASSSFNLSLQLKNANDVTMEIYDAKGQLMKQEVYNNLGSNAEVKTINIDDLANGVYIVKLTSDKISVSKKLVKAAN